jgi:hypothetical protein
MWRKYVRRHRLVFLSPTLNPSKSPLCMLVRSRVDCKSHHPGFDGMLMCEHSMQIFLFSGSSLPPWITHLPQSTSLNVLLKSTTGLMERREEETTMEILLPISPKPRLSHTICVSKRAAQAAPHFRGHCSVPSFQRGFCHGLRWFCSFPLGVACSGMIVFQSSLRLVLR